MTALHESNVQVALRLVRPVGATYARALPKGRGGETPRSQGLGTNNNELVENQEEKLGGPRLRGLFFCRFAWEGRE
jgi:hypothetical protein